MASLYALYRQSMPETFNSSPLVLGLFQTVSDAQEQIAKTYGRAAPWSPPRPGRKRWELRTDRYLYVVEEFAVHQTENCAQRVSAAHGSDEDDDGPGFTTDSIRRLMCHVEQCLEDSAAAARESHENWMKQRSNADDARLRLLQGNERYYLGQAAAFAWIAGCLDRLADQASEGSDGHDSARSSTVSPKLDTPAVSFV